MNINSTILGHRGVGALLTSLTLAACLPAGNTAAAPARVNGFALTIPRFQPLKSAPADSRATAFLPLTGPSLWPRPAPVTCATMTWWSASPRAGTELTWLVSEHLTFGAWRAKYPEGRVLLVRTGFQRDYSAWPYEGYEANDHTMFPVPRHRGDLPNKAWVVGLASGGHALAFPLNRLPSGQPVSAVVGELQVELTFDAASQSVRVRDLDTGEAVPSVKACGFAWQALHPRTKVWRP